MLFWDLEIYVFISCWKTSVNGEPNACDGLQMNWDIRPGQDFLNNILKFILLYENYCILTQASLKIVPNGPISNQPELV